MSKVKKILATIGIVLLLVLLLSGKALPVVLWAITILTCCSWLIIPIGLIFGAGALIWSLWN